MRLQSLARHTTPMICLWVQLPHNHPPPQDPSQAQMEQAKAECQTSVVRKV